MKSILFPQFKTNPLTGWQIQLPKLGKVQINLHRPIPAGFVIKQVRVVKKARGWFAVVAIHSDIELPNPVPHGHAIGVDVGLLSYVATSDGYTEPRPKFFKTAIVGCRRNAVPKAKCYKSKRIGGFPKSKRLGSQVKGLRGECIRKGLWREPASRPCKPRPFKSPVVLSGNLVVDKWRNSPLGVRGARSIREDGSPLSIAKQ